jgi:hypothetical protein
MRDKTNSKKTEAAAHKVVVASVTKEMAQPRVAQSASLTADQQTKKRRGKSTSHHTERAAKRRIEQYGTGTPVEGMSWAVSESRVSSQVLSNDWAGGQTRLQGRAFLSRWFLIVLV